MAIYKRGNVWWYSFIWNGQRVQESTKQSNAKVAGQIEAAHRTRLAKGEVGIIEKLPAPRLREFAQQFGQYISARCVARPQTVSFYASRMASLLRYDGFADMPIDRIDEGVIERFVQWRSNQDVRRKRKTPAPKNAAPPRKVTAIGVNRELATLRRALRLAQEWRLIDRVPRIRLLPGERCRDFVLSRNQEQLYLAAAPQPLKDVATLVLDTGLRLGEAVALQWPDVTLRPVGAARFGFLMVRGGKSRNARRTVPLTARVSEMLSLRTKSSGPWVFPNNKGDAPAITTSLDHAHAKLRTLLKLPSDFVVHSLRHTMLTRLGEAGVEAFAIMRIAGHSSVTVSQRYVHPTPEAIERAFVRLEALNAGSGRGEAEAILALSGQSAGTTSS